MAQFSIAEQMRDHLRRQIVCYERMLAAGESMPLASFDDQTLDAAVRLQSGHAAEIEALRREFQMLLGQWQAAGGLTADERAGVRALAARAEALSSRVSQANEEAIREAGAHRDRLAQTWNELKRGRNMLEAYRVGGPPGATRLDRKT